MLRADPPLVSRWALRWPRLTLVLFSALVLPAALGLARLELRTDGRALVPTDSAAVAADADVRSRFGLHDTLVVLIETEHPDGIWNRPTLELVARLTDRLIALQEVPAGQVMSLATESRDRLDSTDFSPFLSPLPENAVEMASLRDDVLAAGILTGTLISAGEDGAAVLVGVPVGDDRSRLYRRILAVVADLASPGQRLTVVGAPVAEVLLGDHILEDLARLLPLALVVIAALLWVGCGNPWGVLLGLFEVGACLAFTFGTMGWLGLPIHLTTAVLPVILTTVGLADEIHLFWNFQRLAAGTTASPDPTAAHRAAVRATMAEIGRPVILTSLTTAAGFLAFLSADIAPLRIFGACAALGVLFCLLWSLAAIPAQLLLLPPAALRRPTVGEGGWLGRLASWPGRGLGALLRLPRRRLPGLLFLTGITVVAALGIGRIRVQDGWIAGFAEDSRFRQDTERVDAALLGTHLLFAELSFEPSATTPMVRGQKVPLYDPALLEALGELEAFVRRQPGVGGVLGAHSHLSAVGYLARGRRPGTRSIPQSPIAARRMWLRFEQGRGLARRREVADDALERTVMTLFLHQADYRRTAALMAAIQARVSEHLAPFKPSLAFAGDVALSQAMIASVVQGQLASLALALATAGLLVALLFRSLWMACLVLLPPSLAALWLFGAMGWLGVPLGVATSMFCAITLGIGVDFGIHFLERWRLAAARGHRQPTAAALAEAGPAIVLDSLALGLGLGVLGLSQVPANAHLGLLVAGALMACAMITLVGFATLPAPDRPTTR